MKVCKECSVEKNLEHFELQMKNGLPYRRNTCKRCRNTKCYKRKKETGAYERKKERQRLKRHDPIHRAGFIIADAKQFDRYQGLATDLNLVGVQTLIDNGCFYCGETEERIGIDRIDNDLGHTMQNINPCCTRCNFIRRTMPYDAWLLMVPGVREARLAGLFEGWQSGFRHQPVSAAFSGT